MVFMKNVPTKPFFMVIKHTDLIFPGVQVWDQTVAIFGNLT